MRVILRVVELSNVTTFESKSSKARRDPEDYLTSIIYAKAADYLKTTAMSVPDYIIKTRALTPSALIFVFLGCR